MKKLLIANWKMNLSLEEAFTFCNKLVKHDYNNNLIIAPPSIYLSYLSDKFKSLAFSAQDVSKYQGEGNYTGEYSSSLLKLSNINYSIIGHSERRDLLNESNQLIRQKMENCFDADVTPIICIGEHLDLRVNKTYKEFLLRQLVESLPKNYQDLTKHYIIAYEPVWSIGTGNIPKKDELVEVFDIINSFLSQSQVANNISLVYGGSVNLNNIEQILSLQEIDGVLV
ncbi:MAG: triose-phosphate isomerase [Rickettsia endosymbiont of Bryobia graminum]|nr:triose-phosphate isomerase [Rickettsia endosymbiont of Bryobia graminum]